MKSGVRPNPFAVALQADSRWEQPGSLAHARERRLLARTWAPAVLPTSVQLDRVHFSSLRPAPSLLTALARRSQPPSAINGGLIPFPHGF